MLCAHHLQKKARFFHICSEIRRTQTARCQGARSASWQRISAATQSAFIERQPNIGETASTSVKQGKLLDTGNTTATLQRKATYECARERQVHQQHEPYAGGAVTMKTQDSSIAVGWRQHWTAARSAISKRGAFAVIRRWAVLVCSYGFLLSLSSALSAK